MLLWYHENIRVFSDRLVNDEDRCWFDRLLRNTLNEKFNYDANNAIGNDVVLYADFHGPTVRYERIVDLENVFIEMTFAFFLIHVDFYYHRAVGKSSLRIFEQLQQLDNVPDEFGVVRRRDEPRMQNNAHSTATRWERSPFRNRRIR